MLLALVPAHQKVASWALEWGEGSSLLSHIWPRCVGRVIQALVESSGPQSVAPGPAAASPENQLELQIIGPRFRLTESETLRMGPIVCVLARTSRWFCFRWKLKSHWPVRAWTLTVQSSNVKSYLDLMVLLAWTLVYDLDVLLPAVDQTKGG